MWKVILTLLLLMTIVSQVVHAHAEHDKARFVSFDGVDEGLCNNRFRPCKTISYAVSKANKGDTVLVAEGQYDISSSGEMLDVLGGLVPVQGGYNRVDNYQIQNPDKFATVLTGVPTEFTKKVSIKGFDVVSDGKGNQQPLDVDFSSLELMQEKQSASDCIEGNSAGFRCNNVSLLAHLPLSSFSDSSGRANDIWGHIDLNTQKEYAIIGLDNGVSVVDVSQPEQPVIVGTVEGVSTTWRDIKVYQFYDKSTLSWQAYAYSTAESSRTNGIGEGITIIDLNDLPHSISLVTRQLTDATAHNIYISNVDYGLNIALPGTKAAVHVVGSRSFGGALRSYSLEDPEVLGATYSPDSVAANRSYYTHDTSSLIVSDERAQSECKNAEQAGCQVMLDFNENALHLWDHSDPNTLDKLSTTVYPNVGYTHSGWWSEDKNYVFLHDELDERSFDLNTTVHIIDITSLTNPTLVGTWVGPTQATDHNGFVRGNRYYMSNYTRGLTILDISDPTTPTQAGYFDTFPSSDQNAFMGAWGVYPFLPSGTILVSDIIGGLFVLKDETLDSSEGTLRFTQKHLELTEGQTTTLEVQKTGTGATQVSYEILTGSADAGDVAVETGILAWEANDSENKQIQLIPLADGDDTEPNEEFFIRLFDPENGVTLSQPNIATASIIGLPQAGKLSFSIDELTIKEMDTEISVRVNRIAGRQENVSVDYNLLSGTGDAGADIELISGTLTWLDGEAGRKNITLNIIDDDIAEQQESLVLQLNSNVPERLGSITNLTITILDDESNQAPIVSAGEDKEVNVRQTVSLNGSAEDPEGRPVSYLWQQLSGFSVDLSKTTVPDIEFASPQSPGTLEFSLTATDDFGVTTSDNIVVTVVAPQPSAAPSPPTNSGSNKGGGSLYWLTLLCGIVYLRRLRPSV